jgi:hypothetical protein
MRHVFLTLALFVGFCTITKAQFFEIGANLGTSTYEGDLAPSSFIVSFTETHFAGGPMIRYTPHKFVSVRLQAIGSKITGSDTNAEGIGRLQRNLHFRSPLFEVSLTPEWNILGFDPDEDKIFSPYIYSGITVFKFNPQAQLNGTWYELQPLGTEGQGMIGRPEPYKLTQFAVPIGAGIKYAVSPNIIIAGDATVRKTFTDYLDDVSSTYVSRPELIASNGELAADLANRTGEYFGTEPVVVPTGTQRGDPGDKDWYLLVGFTISYRLDGEGGFGGGRSGCYQF